MPYSHNRAPRIVPWSSIHEWQQVYRWLYASDELITNRLRAYSMMECWNFRGRVPVSVESTFMLVGAWLKDQQGSDAEETVRMLYSMAIIRFVNGLVDQQQKGTFAMPITALAQQINLPRYLVDLRHSATHDSLPTIHILRNACNQSLEWLRSNYWQPQSDFAGKLEHQIRDELGKYATHVASDSTQMDPIDSIIQMCDDHQARTELVPILLEPDFLVPKDKKKRNAMSRDDSSEHWDHWYPALKSFTQTWSTFPIDLLEFICRQLHRSEHNLSTNDKDSNNADQSSNSYRACLAYLAKHLITADDLIMTGLDAQTIRTAVLRHPSVFTFILVKLLSKKLTDVNGEITEEQWKAIKRLSEFGRNRSTVTNAEDINPSMMELMKSEVDERESRFQQLLLASQHHQKSAGLESGAGMDLDDQVESVEGWSACKESEWAYPCAIGLLPTSIAKQRQGSMNGVIPNWQRSKEVQTWTPLDQSHPHGILPSLECHDVIKVE